MEHLVIAGLTRTLNKKQFRKFLEKEWNNGGDSIDVKLTVGSVELDIQAVCSEWEKQIDEMVKKEAMKIVEEKYKKSLGGSSRRDKGHEGKNGTAQIP